MIKKFIYSLGFCPLTLAIILFLHIPTHAGVLITRDFDQGTLSGWQWYGSCCSYSQQIVTSPVRAGKYAARFELRYTDPQLGGGPRSQVNLVDNRIGKIGGPDEWYGVSTYLPSDWSSDSLSEILVQWHGERDRGEVSRPPVLSISTVGYDWNIGIMHSSIPIQTSPHGTWVDLWGGRYQTGVWTDWVVHVKWSYQSDGFVEIWKDGVKIINYQGPNCYNDKKNVWFALNVYKWPWVKKPPTNVTQRVIYFDELRIGDSSSSYAEVAPPTPDAMPPSQPFLNINTASSGTFR